MIQHGGQKHVAPMLGVEEEDIRFIQYVVFNRRPIGKTIDGIEGIAVLTDEKIALIPGMLSTMTVGTENVIPLSEVDGLHLRNGQIQLKSGFERIVIWVVSGRPYYNETDTKRLYRMLLAEGVRPWKSEVTYQLRLGRNPNSFRRYRNYRNWNRNPITPTRGEAAYRAGYVTR